MLSTGNLRGWSSRMYRRSCWQQHRCVRRRVGKTPTSVVLGNNLCAWFWFVRWEPPPRAIFHQRGCWQQHRCAERVFGKPPSSVVLWKQPSFFCLFLLFGTTPMSKLQCENTRQLFGCVCVFVWFGSFSLFCLFCWFATNPHEQFTMLSTGNL